MSAANDLRLLKRFMAFDRAHDAALRAMRDLQLLRRDSTSELQEAVWRLYPRALALATYCGRNGIDNLSCTRYIGSELADEGFWAWVLTEPTPPKGIRTWVRSILAGNYSHFYYDIRVTYGAGARTPDDFADALRQYDAVEDGVYLYATLLLEYHTKVKPQDS